MYIVEIKKSQRTSEIHTSHCQQQSAPVDCHSDSFKHS